MRTARERATGTRNVFPRALPLRHSLLLILVTVSFLGLLSSAFAVNVVMRQVIYGQVDKDLVNAARGWARSEELYGEDVTRYPPTDYSIISYRENGAVKYFNIEPNSVPKVADLVVGGAPQTVAAVTGDGPFSEKTGEWRAVAAEYKGTIIVVAKQVKRENTQLNGLATMQIFISLAVAVLVFLVGLSVSRRALKPLREVERTAARIADGDLGERVPHWPEHTEVGQLSRALNSMIERLQESVENAQSKEEQMRRFVGDASHELRTPLTSLRGYTELYQSGAMPDADKAMSIIDAESKRMSVLVEDLLALTNAEDNRPEYTTVDMLELVLNVGATARGAFPDRCVEVVNKAGSIPLVSGQADRLHRVFLNLVANGLKHGGPEASVAIELRRDAHNVYVDVIDDGAGMPPEVAAHIFERFYRADESRTRDTGGSGLGLAISKTLVEQHDGQLSVNSVEGKGSTFTVSLPALSD
ncbi:histidine kinase [Corynebacterium phocae]|uniref:histidine kinase n=1 Tax=Corynebacterium phocae TaxID=161895 RepID=A0A1L7D663_9CORY|nr:histidine kinase [Corynebacterium phocae]